MCGISVQYIQRQLRLGVSIIAPFENFDQHFSYFWLVDFTLSIFCAYCFSIWCTILAIDRGIEEDKAFSSLSVNNLLSRDILLSFPTVGTILRVSRSSHLFHQVKPGDWVKLYHLLCEVDRGSWVGKVTDSTKVHLARDDPLVEKIMRLVLLEVSFGNYFRPFCLPRESLLYS